ncbi:MAG: V-type ATPase subunit, partial [Oscillospiraceae bacterium]|nr:V-type ATPase subunit [Oscillospiraceae bacterium]
MITLEPNESLYLVASGRVRGLENTLLTPEKLTRLIDAEDVAAAYRVVSECGYAPPAGAPLDGTQGIYTLSRMLDRAAEELYALCEELSESKDLTDFFRVRIDAHNLKTVLKSERAGRDPDPNLLSGGVFRAAELKDAVLSGKTERLGEIWRKAAAEAGEILTSVGDGQRCDFVLDNAMFRLMSGHAAASGSRFLKDYAAFCADKANLRTAVRLKGVSNAEKLAELAVNEQGSVAKTAVVASVAAGGAECFARTGLASAAEEGIRARGAGEPLTAFERLLDRADGDFFRDVKYLGMGAPVLISYIRRRETEQSTIRKVISAKLSGADRAE